MKSLRFDENELRKRLAPISKVRTVAFSACCANRLANSVIEKDEDLEKHDCIDRAIAIIWDGVISGEFCGDLAAEQELIDLMPDEDDGAGFISGLVEDAAASTFYALRSGVDDRIQNAIWAARRVYDTADRFAGINLKDKEYTKYFENFVVNSDIVQTELTRQNRDLFLIESDEEDQVIFQELRNISMKECVLGWGAGSIRLSNQ